MTPVKHNLVALGSAAVLAVYAAGYSRTRAAAAQFEVQSENRRPRAPVPAQSAPVQTPVQVARVAGAMPTVANTTRDATHAPVATKKTGHQTASAEAHTAGTATKTRDTAAKKPAADTANPNIVAPAVAAKAASTPDSTRTASTQATDSATKAASADQAAFKDGTYSAWGTSRHGDIEATVLIKGGKIEAAIISQCLTQYSCSLISELPIQVVLRQSPEVDFVSGATQSTNAFYYAVVNALKKAK